MNIKKKLIKNVYLFFCVGCISHLQENSVIMNRETIEMVKVLNKESLIEENTYESILYKVIMPILENDRSEIVQKLFENAKSIESFEDFLLFKADLEDTVLMKAIFIDPNYTGDEIILYMRSIIDNRHLQNFEDSLEALKKDLNLWFIANF